MSFSLCDGRGREIGIGGIFKIGFAKYGTRLSPSPRSTEAENARAAFKISKNRPQIAADRQLPRARDATDRQATVNQLDGGAAAESQSKVSPWMVVGNRPPPLRKSVHPSEGKL